MGVWRKPSLSCEKQGAYDENPQSNQAQEVLEATKSNPSEKTIDSRHI
jgi:hypothetical protein